jgi:molybdopterin-guanine dinucleotide biosynthesis protein A
MSESMPKFSAVLLAGGQSSRMGRDKALLPLPGTDLLLWQRQLEILAELKPREIFWSGAQRPGIPAHVRVVPDSIANAGPLAGISACLDVLESDLLVVLAIDLPQMTATFLHRLLEKCSSNCGAVVEHGNFFEPLAAVYPRSLRELVSEQLRQGRLALQDIVQAGRHAGMLHVFPLEEKDTPLFQNVNSPEDWLGQM